MKWSLPLVALAGLVAASPVELDRRTAERPWTRFRLRVSAEYAPEVDGAYLTISKSQKIGIYPGVANTSLQFSTADHDMDGTYQLDLTPPSKSTITLVGQYGGFEMMAVSNPAATTWPIGTTALWSDFDLGPNYPPPIVLCVPSGFDYKREVPLRRDQLVTYNTQAKGRWVAFPSKVPGGWDATYLDGSGVTTQNYIPIQVVWELVPFYC